MRFPRLAIGGTRTIGARLQWATAAAVISVSVLLVSIYVVDSARIGEARTTLLRSIVDSATAIAASFEKEERAGHMTRAEAQRAAAEAIGAIRYLGGEYVWINDLHPTMVMHPIKPELNGKDLGAMMDPNGKHLFVAFADTVREKGAGEVDYLWPRPGAEAPVPKLSFVQGFQPWGWVIGTGVYIDDLAAARRRMALSLTGLGAAAGLIVGVVIWSLGRGITRPVRDLAAVTERLSGGDLTVAVTGTGRGDEFGTLARALEVLKGNSLERVRLERVADDERAAKDRRQAAMDHLTRDFGEVISAVLARLTQAARTMSETARAMTDGTTRTRDSVTRTAEGSTGSARDLATVASATVELSSSVDEIARQVAHATGATRDAVERTAETDATFLRLSHMAGRIGDIGGVIASIAAQTNLLALNATIEAARAGDAGKGFAVVANEVKALATQTGRATAEISENVAAIRSATDQTALAIREVCSAVERVDSVSAAIAAAIEEQGATTRDIANNVRNVARTSERTSADMMDVAAIADGTGEMSQSVLAASGDIAEVAATLRDEVDQFLKTMSRDEGYRRRYERLPGNAAQATLVTRDGRRAEASVQDISRGGAALRCSFECGAGDPIELMLPGTPDRIGARVVRNGAGTLAIAFQQDDRNMSIVDLAIAAVSGEPPLRRAA